MAPIIYLAVSASSQCGYCIASHAAAARGEALEPCAGWTWNRHGHYDSHIPEAFPKVTFSTQRVDSR